MSKIIQLSAENVKRLRAVQIAPNGQLVVIGGDNGNGKSSVLDSIAMALGGKDEIPGVPVRKGEAKASVVLELDEDLIIKRTFTAEGGTTLTVTNKAGAKYPSPQSILDKLTGKFTFDPLAFLRLDAKKQAETIKRLVGLDFTTQDLARKATYDERTLVNRHVDQQEARIAAMAHHVGLPTDPIDTQALMTELDLVRAHNATKADLERAVQREQATLDGFTTKLAACERGIADLEAQIKQLEERLATSKDNRRKILDDQAAAEAPVEKAKRALAAFEPRDEAPIRQKLADASRTNADIQTNKLREDAVRALTEHKAKSAALTKKIEAIDADKAAQLAAAKFPIPGLSFDEDGLTYVGLPLDQASSAEQLRVSVAIAAALNPSLKVMLLRDGSLLDDKSMALLADLAEKHGLQVWVERVGKDQHVSVVIEDGAIAN